MGTLAGTASQEDETTAHVLRQTFGTTLVRGCADLILVAELMGHARLEGRPEPDSRPFGWRDGQEFDELAAGCRLGPVDAEGGLLAQAGYDGAADFLPDPEAGPEW